MISVIVTKKKLDVGFNTQAKEYMNIEYLVSNRCVHRISGSILPGKRVKIGESFSNIHFKTIHIVCLFVELPNFEQPIRQNFVYKHDPLFNHIENEQHSSIPLYEKEFHVFKFIWYDEYILTTTHHTILSVHLTLGQ